MLSLKVVNMEGQEVGSIEVNPADFGGEVNRQLLHDVVLMQLANRRAGTHSTLRRGEVAGSTKKIFRQKGTGRARAGSKRTNKRVGGGTAKGPKPRDYEYHMPKKAVRAATRMAVLSKLADNEAIIVDSISIPDAKTKSFRKLLANLKLRGTKTQVGERQYDRRIDGLTCLVGLPQADDNTWRSARNIPGVAVLPVNEFNALTIMRQKRLVLTREALEALRSTKAMA
ncbi:MAG: 50S ribosomal protein L4 [Planctomycetota bacterium]|nr:50S ribosomal protein L4 [Planctomycetota bacterium]